MKKIFLSLIGFFFVAAITAQTNRIRGKVIDSQTQKALIDAKITTSLNQVIASDSQGEFDLPCTKDLTITVSYIGYRTIKKTIKTCSKYQVIALTASVNTLNEVTVFGTKNNKELLRTPKSEVQISTRELKRGTGVFLDDAINANIPGVTMSRRGVSSGQQFNIRGAGNGVGFKGITNNFDGQGYKVYLNNIPITDAEGITIMDDIDFGSIGNVDVIKGPAGSVYGLAIAGVVNLQTRRSKRGTTSLSQKTLVGSYGLNRFTTQFETATNNSSLLLNYSHQTADGFMDHTASNKDFFNLIFDFKPSSKQSVSAYLGYSNSYDERGGELTISQYKNFDYSGNPRYIKNNAHSKLVSFRAGVSHDYQFNNWLKNTTAIFGSGVNSNSSSAGGWNDKNPINYGVRSTFDFSFDVGNTSKLTGIAGFEFQEQRTQIAGYSMVANPSDPNGYNVIGDAKSNQFAISKNGSLFTEWTLHLPNDFSVVAGLSTSNMNIHLENRLYDANSTKPRIVTANYSGLISPHFAINKVVNNNMSLYASYSKGYHAPVSGSIVISATGDLNTGLAPEVANQFEIGSKGNIFNNKLHYQVALFNAIFKDKFTSVAVPLNQNTTAYSYITNGGKQDNKGVEILLKYDAYQSANGFFSTISPYANLTYSHFKYKNFEYQSVDRNTGNISTVNFSGNDVAGVAPWMANAGVDFTSNTGFYGTLNYSFKDAVPFTSDEMNYTDAYSLLNTKIGFKKDFSHFTVDLYAGINNITGTQYYYMVFLNQLNDAYLPAPYKANYYGGINLKYNF